MPIVVKAVTETEYKQWIEQTKATQEAAVAGADREWALAELIERGQAVYSTNCAGCHQTNGQGLPPTFPALTGSPVATGPIENHIEVVVNGRTGTPMQAFGKQLNTVDIAAVVTFERNALGNSVGDMVQPAQIPAAR